MGAMHAVVRAYSGQGAKELLDVLEKNKTEIERLIRGINGFVSFSLARADDGGFTVSVFQDKAGTDESVRVAREWISKNAGGIGAAPPKVTEGSVFLRWPSSPRGRHEQLSSPKEAERAKMGFGQDQCMVSGRENELERQL
jgi:hypothetical protein